MSSSGSEATWVEQKMEDAEVEEYLAYLRTVLPFQIERPLHGGMSGARVYSIDIQPSRIPGATHGDPTVVGHHVLKVCPRDTANDERVRHQTAKESDLGPHVPEIVGIVPSPLRISGILYRVATGGLLFSTTLDRLSATAPSFASEIVGALARTLLRWSTYADPAPADVLDVIRYGLAWRLGGSGVPPSVTIQHRLSEILPVDTSQVLIEHIPRPLWNPVHCLHAGTKTESRFLIMGPSHGDLHAGNVVVPKARPSDSSSEPSFALIDFYSLRRGGNALFDLAYLELSLVLHSFTDWRTEAAVRDWWQLESYLAHEQGQHATGRAHALLRPLWSALREEAATKGRKDAYFLSFLAAGVEAGLNYARKLTCDRWRQQVALAHAASRFTRLAESLDLTLDRASVAANVEWPRPTDARVAVGSAPARAVPTTHTSNQPRISRPPKHAGGLVDGHELFTERLHGMGVAPVTLGEPDSLDLSLVREPKFLLFDRGGTAVMAVVPSSSKVRERSLQKTTEPQLAAKLLSPEAVRALGLSPANVHPIIRDASGQVRRILWDALLFAQAAMFPDSLLMLPGPDHSPTRKLIVPIAPAFAALRAHHAASGGAGPEMIFANIGSGSWPDELLMRLLTTRDVKTRFAPTPSGPLHLGNARTALATYAFYRAHLPRAEFHIRIDDTDPDRVAPGATDMILNDLQWLGIPTQRVEKFHQSDPERYWGVYKRGEAILAASRQLVVRDGKASLSMSGLDDYTNLWFDWRRGPRISHRAPQRRAEKVELESREKSIELIRDGAGLPFYRYAGIVDDMLPYASFTAEQVTPGPPPITYVLRDNRQEHLTEVQAHIRSALEAARVGADTKVRAILMELGLDPGRPLPLPLYVHVPFVTNDDGSLLKKRDEDGQILMSYTLAHLRNVQGVVPEGLVAYLLQTILPTPPGARPPDHLDYLARFLGANGITSGIAAVAKGLDLRDLVRSLKPVKAHLRGLRRASRIALASLPPWILSRRLLEATPERPADPVFISRLHAHSSEFADWNQVVACHAGPGASGEISAPTCRLLEGAWAHDRDLPADDLIQFVASQIRDERDRVRLLAGPRKDSERFRELAETLRDLRLLLTGSQASPPVEVLLEVLGPREASRRLQAFDAWRKS